MNKIWLAIKTLILLAGLISIPVSIWLNKVELFVVAAALIATSQVISPGRDPNYREARNMTRDSMEIYGLQIDGADFRAVFADGASARIEKYINGRWITDDRFTNADCVMFRQIVSRSRNVSSGRI